MAANESRRKQRTPERWSPCHPKTSKIIIRSTKIDSNSLPKRSGAPWALRRILERSQDSLGMLPGRSWDTPRTLWDAWGCSQDALGRLRDAPGHPGTLQDVPGRSRTPGDAPGRSLSVPGGLRSALARKRGRKVPSGTSFVKPLGDLGAARALFWHPSCLPKQNPNP